GLLLIGLRWLADPHLQAIFHLDARQLQTVMFLQLAVGGHLLLFVVGPQRFLFGRPFPSPRLFLAIVGTQIAAIPGCYLGVGVPAIPMAAIVAVWIYCLVWMVVLDILKVGYWHITAQRDRTMSSQRSSLIA